MVALLLGFRKKHQTVYVDLELLASKYRVDYGRVLGGIVFIAIDEENTS